MARAKTTERSTVDDRTPKAPATSSAAVTDSAIARRAYERYLARGGEHGHDVEDWIQAERELNEARIVAE